MAKKWVPDHLFRTVVSGDESVARFPYLPRMTVQRFEQKGRLTPTFIRLSLVI
ncbi:MAG: hypothetical protein ING75_09860 [Rhodocyclaceae bacterium]|nr:hypothetical protein [Rhodocyclaceae bacterium]